MTSGLNVEDLRSSSSAFDGIAGASDVPNGPGPGVTSIPVGLPIEEHKELYVIHEAGSCFRRWITTQTQWMECN